MKILFIHQNFPGQFKHLAPALVKAGHEVFSLSQQVQKIDGIRSATYPIKRGSTAGIHPLASDFENKVIRGEACAQTLDKLAKSGFTPDLIIGHPGWGELLFVKKVYPNVKQLHFVEFFYQTEGSDTDFDPEFVKTDLAFKSRVEVKNACNLLSLMSMDWAYSPTQWQFDQVPEPFRHKTEVIFDGIDTKIVCPAVPGAVIKLKLTSPNGTERTVQSGDEILTFVNRNLEPYRGYHVFIRALPEIQKRRPNAITLIIGGDKVSYGEQPPEGKTWKSIFLEEVIHKLDMSRIFFLGHQSYQNYLNILRVSRCHAYLTYPFVLSWSCVEAMSIGCVVVGSKTRPVQDVIEHDKTGLLVDFFDQQGWIESISDVLAQPDKYEHIRQAARQVVINKYDLDTVCLPKQLELVNRMLKGSD